MTPSIRAREGLFAKICVCWRVVYNEFVVSHTSMLPVYIETTMRIIVVTIVMLTIAGCGDGAPGSKADADVAHADLNSQFASGPRTSEAKFNDAKRKAEAGRAKDQLVLARRYYYGDGVVKDDAKAVEWYRKAAEQGNAFAQYNLGVMYQKGEGVPVDAVMATQWWQKAAAQGNEAAQESLMLFPLDKH